MSIVFFSGTKAQLPHHIYSCVLGISLVLEKTYNGLYEPKKVLPKCNPLWKTHALTELVNASLGLVLSLIDFLICGNSDLPLK